MATTIGNDSIGGAQTNLRNGFRIFTKVTLPNTDGGTIDQVELYCGGNGSAGAGTATFKCIVYRDVGAVPTTLLGYGQEVSVAFGAALAWRASVITVPAVIPSGDTAVWIGHHGGPTDNVILYNRNATGGSGGFVADTYADGAADPSGAVTSDVTNQQSHRANFTSAGAATGGAGNLLLMGCG
jgi:hypothetical protein